MPTKLELLLAQQPTPPAKGKGAPRGERRSGRRSGEGRGERRSGERRSGERASEAEAEAELEGAAAPEVPLEEIQALAIQDLTVTGITDLERGHLKLVADWTLALARRDESWRALYNEKRAGWSSKAVEWWWREQDAYWERSVDRSKKHNTPNTAKYVRFYREWMPRLDAELFRPDFGPDGRPKRFPDGKRFADLGAAPGGMCEYLVTHLGWSGVGFSLPVEQRGFGMLFHHAECRYEGCDVTVEGEWQRMLEVVGDGGCDFVNAGVVVDRGQRGDDKAGKAESKRVSAAEDAALSDVRIGEFVAIARNELIFALRALAPGGALYFAFQLGQYGLFFRLLSILRPAFKGAMRTTPTFAPGRTPVYVYLGDYLGGDSDPAQGALAFLQATEPTDENFADWHVPGGSWSSEIGELHASIKDDLSSVWSQQTHHLRKQRVQAEAAFVKLQAESEARGSAGHGKGGSAGYGGGKGGGGKGGGARADGEGADARGAADGAPASPAAPSAPAEPEADGWELAAPKQKKKEAAADDASPPPDGGAKGGGRGGADGGRGNAGYGRGVGGAAGGAFRRGSGGQGEGGAGGRVERKW